MTSLSKNVKAKLEYMGEDKDFPGAKLWSVEAIHVTTTRNKRKYTESELSAAARSLSFRPLNINHEESQTLPFPGNTTMFMEYDRLSRSVKGTFRVIDPHVNEMINSNRINTVSIEQLPTAGETCNKVSCEQHGVAFIGLALLEAHLMPGDENAVIKKEMIPIEEIFVGNLQRECIRCTDEVKCNSCKHTEVASDACVSRQISHLADTRPDMGKDQRIAVAISKCEVTNKDEAWRLYKKFENYNTNED